MKPAVSVVIPIYREGFLLSETLDSVLAQTFQDYEIVLVDNNATQTTKQIAQQYLTLYPNKIRLLQENEQGVCSARNTGIRAAKADLIAFLDADDLMKPTRLEKQCAILNGRNDLSLVSSYIDKISHDSKAILAHKIGDSIFCQELKKELLKVFKNNFNPPYLNTFHYPYPSTWLVRKDKIIQAGLFDIRLNPRLHEDNEILPRIFRQGGFINIPESLVEYRSETEKTRISKNKDLNMKRLHHDQTYFFLLWNQFGDSHPDNQRIFRRILVLFLRNLGVTCMKYSNGQKLGRKLFIRTLLLPPSPLLGLKLFLKTFLPRSYYHRLFWFEQNKPLDKIDSRIDGDFLKTYLSWPPSLPEYVNNGNATAKEVSYAPMK